MSSPKKPEYFLLFINRIARIRQTNFLLASNYENRKTWGFQKNEVLDLLGLINKY